MENPVVLKTATTVRDILSDELSRFRGVEAFFEIDVSDETEINKDGIAASDRSVRKIADIQKSESIPLRCLFIPSKK